MLPGWAEGRCSLVVLALLVVLLLPACEVAERCRGPYCECSTDEDCMITLCYQYPIDAPDLCPTTTGCPCDERGNPVSVEEFYDHYLDDVSDACRDHGGGTCLDACADTLCAPSESGVPACRDGRCVVLRETE